MHKMECYNILVRVRVRRALNIQNLCKYVLIVISIIQIFRKGCNLAQIKTLIAIYNINLYKYQHRITKIYFALTLLFFQHIFKPINKFNSSTSGCCSIFLAQCLPNTIKIPKHQSLSN
jgi:hypothetical protein